MNHESCLHAPNFEDRTQDETLQQDRSARREALDLAKRVHQLKGKDNATFHSASEVWSLPAASIAHAEQEDLTIAELEIVQKHHNGYHSQWEVQTSEDATVYVYDLDLFVTAQILKDTLRSPIAGKTLR